VTSLAELVASPALHQLLGYVSRPPEVVDVQGVSLVEDLGHLERVRPGSIVLLTRQVSAAVSSDRFDMALRVASGRNVAALVVRSADVGSVASTTVAIADRTGMAILGTPDGTDLADLALSIGRELSGDAEVALLRAHTAVRAIEAHPADGTVESLLDRVSGALGVPVTMSSTGAQGPASWPVVVDDRVECWITARAQEGDAAMGLEIALQAAVHSVAAALGRARRTKELPTQSRHEALTDVLSATPSTRDQAALRARSAGFPIDGWHVVARLDFAWITDQPDDELSVYEDRVRLGASALRAAQRGGGTWHEARAGESFLLIKTYSEDPGVGAAEEVATEMDGVLSGVRAELPAALIRCGVGLAAPGARGLLSSLAESKAASIVARNSPGAGAVSFDNLGLRRALVEWYASDTAREAARSILAPLSELGGARAERLIQTLHVYLDERGSLTRTAQRMSLHRNAVAYRIKQAFDVLEVDRSNSDDLLLLQLACRARDLD
jgi:hypothetical protein